MPKYQRNLPRPGQASLGNPPVGPIGGMMPPQPGIPPQQQGMRPPMPPHGNLKFPSFLLLNVFGFPINSSKKTLKWQILAGGEAFHKVQLLPFFFKNPLLCISNVLFVGQYGAHHQGMPGYLPGAMPPYGQGPPMVPPYQSGPPRPPMGMRPPVMSQGGRY